MAERQEPLRSLSDLGAAFDRPAPRNDDRRDPPRQGGGNWQGGGGGDRGRPTGGPSGGLPEGYLRNGYFDETGNLRPELITDHARLVAQALANAKPEMSATALKRFFGKVRRAENFLATGTLYPAVRVDILELEPLAAQSVNRRIVPQLFEQFIRRNLALVTDDRSFRQGFVRHFQYVVAYFPRTR